MKKKYTPGEWIVNEKASGHVRTKDGRGIATTMGYSTNMDNGEHIIENQANAVLISAAPDLLEALEKVMPYIGNFPSFLQDEIKSALTKATNQ